MQIPLGIYFLYSASKFDIKKDFVLAYLFIHQNTSNSEFKKLFCSGLYLVIGP